MSQWPYASFAMFHHVGCFSRQTTRENKNFRFSLDSAFETFNCGSTTRNQQEIDQLISRDVTESNTKYEVLHPKLRFGSYLDIS